LSVMWGATLAVAVVAVLAGRARGLSPERLEEAFSFVDDSRPAERAAGTPAPLAERVLRPLLRWVAERFQKLVRPAEGSERLLRAAGYPLRLDVVELVGLKVGAAVVATMAMGALLILLPRLLPFGPLVLCLAAAMGFLLPSAVLSRLAARRRFEMQLALPDMLDLITLSVEAGLGFDGAVARAVASTTGPLSEELTRVLTEVGQGRPRVVAFGDLAARTKIEELSLLVATVQQSEQLGASIGQALRELGDQLREERVYRAREIIAKLPVKMLFPLMVFIFPALFIVILGPAAVMLRQSSLMGLP